MQSILFAILIVISVNIQSAEAQSKKPEIAEQAKEANVTASQQAGRASNRRVWLTIHRKTPAERRAKQAEEANVTASQQAESKAKLERLLIMVQELKEELAKRVAKQAEEANVTASQQAERKAERKKLLMVQELQEKLAKGVAKQAEEEANVTASQQAEKDAELERLLIMVQELKGELAKRGIAKPAEETNKTEKVFSEGLNKSTIAAAKEGNMERYEAVFALRWHYYREEYEEWKESTKKRRFGEFIDDRHPEIFELMGMLIKMELHREFFTREMDLTFNYIIAVDMATSDTALLPLYKDRIISLKETAKQADNPLAVMLLDRVFVKLEVSYWYRKQGKGYKKSAGYKDRSTKGSTSLVPVRISLKKQIEQAVRSALGEISSSIPGLCSRAFRK